MKRRRLIQYAGLGSVGLFTGVGSRSLAAVIATPERQAKQLRQLQSFNFEVVKINQQGLEIDRHRQQSQFFAVALNASPPLEMVAVAGGRFRMGAADTERFSAPSESPQHQVAVQPFFISKYLITQSQWQAVAALPKVSRDLNPNPAHFKGMDLPVESVSWLDAVEFCDRLSQSTGTAYRLPSEAEWEYACRAGTSTPFHYGKTITSQVANYGSAYAYAAEAAGGYRQSTMPVGSFSPNA
ncbi:MAG TPA: formylglycine-generating enzyme family protein, partial [Coleofasciculaceae cyanobacterium]